MANEHPHSWLRDFLEIIDEYGIFKIVIASFIFIFTSLVAYIAFNPAMIFEKYDAYIEQKHTESFNYRMENTPILNNIMRQMVLETKSMRSFVIEMHNGKSNSAGLSFNYGALTYEGLRDNIETIKEDYSDFTLDRFPVLSIVYNKGCWMGTIDELKRVDKRLALRLESNGARYVALQMLYGKKTEIGFIGITYGINDNIPEKNIIEKFLHQYAPKIAPLLDGENAKNRNNQ